MNKLCLVILFLLFSGRAMTQTNTLILQEPPVTSGAINIVTSNLEEADGNTYFAEALKNERRGDLNDALNLYAKAAFEFNTAKLFVRYGEALLKLGNVHLMMNHYTEAEQVILNVALKNYSKIGSKTGQMEAYYQLGRIYFAANKLTQSLWFYTQQGILAKQINNNTAYIESVIGIAQVKIKKKEYNLALTDLNRAELLLKSINNGQLKSRIKEAKALIPSKSIAKKS
ncbi:hypothetical protein [Pedobacter gandavensis]|uniref:Tetratricopeptide repeat protein n=1 Tax=Pedobacter gandavensis TaxID=2679963 RepID=A0ABR6F0G8_9SPHI|nr:hypothetical protein [Pedobacter gandavensis]MBB2150994.1 hypothetical protein [Pedobacter gandavensis]